MDRPASRGHRWFVHAAALVIVLYAALLRLDALVGKYGALDHPAWARVATHQVASLAAHLRPPGWQWGRVDRPYVGGDPVNYLAFARRMESFYQAQVREPVFLALVRGALWLVDDQDVGLSFASVTGSVLLVVATFLLGTALLSPAAGLLASALMAAEMVAVVWAPDGWRDDLFAALTVLTAWALLRLSQHPTVARALAAGALCGLACLTRVTALAFVLPVLALIVAAAPRAERRLHARFVGLTLLTAAALVAPYLINCAIATGDPLYALNYHTTYYRHAEGQDVSRPVSAAAYIGSKFASRPLATLDDGFIGLFVWPFATKWTGWNPWLPAVGPAAEVAALAGLGMLLSSSGGRLLLLLVVTSLLPYAFTWKLGGGGEWRFTLHAYAIYIVAAAFAMVSAARALCRRREAAASMASVARRAAPVAAVAIAGVALYYWLPWPVVNEAIAAGESASIETGPRDRVFFREGWSDPHLESVTVRVSTGPWGVARIPLPARRAYQMVLRLDPVAPEAHQRVRVLLNRQQIAQFPLAWNPDRVGAYPVTLPADIVRAGSNELVILPEPTVDAGSAGPHFAWLDPRQRIGVRLWYLRVVS
jgi:hypothetical protein